MPNSDSKDAMIADLHYGQMEVIREGFPILTPLEFVAMFCEHMKCAPDTEITRLEFRYVI